MPLPRVGVLAASDERLKLLRALADSGRLRPLWPLPEREGVSAGLFAVVKDLEKDRLILDALPANTLESPPSFWTGSLASVSVLLPLVLAPDEEVRVSSADLKDFFYLFKVPDQRLQQNLFSGKLTSAEAEFVFGSRQRRFEDRYGCLGPETCPVHLGDGRQLCVRICAQRAFRSPSSMGSCCPRSS